MKKLLLLVLLLTGCSSIPKDSLVRNLEIGATPWTPTVKADVIATGSAAKNLSVEERKEMLTPTKK